MNSSLKDLNLYYNSIGADGARALADGLKVTSRSIFLYNLFHFSATAKKSNVLFVHVLQVNNSLQSLNLQSNDIQSDGAKAIAEALLVSICVFIVVKLELQQALTVVMMLEDVFKIPICNDIFW